MSSRVAVILIVLGIFLLAGQVFYQKEREKRFYELSLIQQRESIATGLSTKWSEYLLKLARERKLPKSYVLRWDRTGSELKSPFFPTAPVKKKWSTYRTLKNTSEQQEFLKAAMTDPYSWDRILGIQEWHRRFGSLPAEIKPNDFERTLIEPEARSAFALIFKQFESGHDFTLVTPELEMGQVLYHVDNGEIEAFIPSANEISKTILPGFLSLHQLRSATLGNVPWDIRFETVQNFEPGPSWVSYAISLLALVFLGGGVIFYWATLADQKQQLSQRVTFLNQVVHELKTPLTGLKLHLQLMKRIGPTPDTLQAIDHSVNRIDRLFDEIVMINRPNRVAELGYIQPDWLNQKLLDWQKEYPPGAVEIKGKLETPIFSETHRLEIVFRNLIANAVKYGTCARIQIEELENETAVSIQDDGLGVSHEESKSIFDEFYRSENAKRIAVDGIGLGLALVKKLSEELRCKVQLANPGQPRAIFIVHLPKEKT